ncbi:MAG: hypothetical protein AAF705_15360, partial [Bacteroidota bacterium]
MQNQNIFFPIEILVDYCNGSLDAETTRLITEAAEDNALLQSVINEINNLPTAPKLELKEQIDQSMQTFLASDQFNHAFDLETELPGLNVVTTQVKAKYLRKSRIPWILGTIMLGLIGLVLLLTNYRPETSSAQLILPAQLDQQTSALNSAFKLSGKVKNAEGTYAVFMYIPRMRGTLNYDGFNNIGTWIASDGSFAFDAETITHGGNYTLKIKDKYVSIVAFEEDQIQLEMDLSADSNIFFARGRGAGKINVLDLPQFDYVPFDADWTKERFRGHSDSVVTTQIALLDAIYTKDLDHKLIVEATNRNRLERIIKESPLTTAEYQHLKTSIKTYSVSVVDYFSQLDQNDLKIDLSGSIFDYFSSETYQQINHINDWKLGNALDKILHVEYLRYKHGDLPITQEEWKSALRQNSIICLCL